MIEYVVTVVAAAVCAAVFVFTLIISVYLGK